MTTMTWQEVVNSLAQEGAESTARISSHLVENPRDGGLTPTLSPPRGQRASFRAELADGRIVVVDDFGAIYEARLERLTSSKPCAPLGTGNALGEAVGMAALGALVGLMLGQSERSAMTGALLGGAIGLGATGIRDADASPEASKASLAFAEKLASLALANSGTGARKRSLGAVSKRRQPSLLATTPIKAVRQRKR